MPLYRPPDTHDDWAALLPLGLAVQHQSQAQSTQQVCSTSQGQLLEAVVRGHDGAHQVATVAPISHKQVVLQHGQDGDHQVAAVAPVSHQQAGLQHGQDGVHQVAVQSAPVSLFIATEVPLSSPYKPCSSVGVYHGAEEIPAHVSQHDAGSHAAQYDTGDLRPLTELVSNERASQSTTLPVDHGIHTLNPEAEIFCVRDPTLVHQGRLLPDLGRDWDHVQQVQAGGVGDLGETVDNQWNESSMITTRLGSEARANHSSANQSEPILPFQLLDDVSDVLGLAPKQVLKVNMLLDAVVDMPRAQFTDKALPTPEHVLSVNEEFTADYYIALHNITAAPGIKADGTMYSSFTPNHLGARVKMPHVKLRIDRWRHHLLGYEHSELVQYMEYGFPLGLSSLPDLESCTRNHGSAYMWYKHVDKFICNEVTEGGMTGPFRKAPWWDTIVSPLMTAHKKVKSRRTVFDATFGDKSLNNATPSDSYMGLPCKYTFPKIEDYKTMILNSGHGAFMWKRDLSRFYLQLPLDPTEYNRVGVIWRGLFFFFVGLAFGLRHSGLQGQRVTDAVSWILRGLGRDNGSGQPYQVCNYVDDLGGVETNMARATAAFEKLGWLLSDLGLDESIKKSEPPTTRITYLGVEFDSVQMTMSVPPEKITEIKAEIGGWVRKTTITKKELQSLLGKLFWVAKVVKYARAFMGRLLTQLRNITNEKDNKKVKLTDESRKDILWWRNYLDKFNGISMIINDDPIPLSYTQLLDSPHEICAGDATPTSGGAWHGREYWCGDLPDHLKDPKIPIHIKEFWVLIVSAKVWGDTWTGRCLVIFCDNDSVCDTVQHRKPRDPALLSLLREFLHIVVTKKFFPVVRKIGTKENAVADHISRRYDSDAAAKVFAENGLHDMKLIKPRAQYFQLSATW